MAKLNGWEENIDILILGDFVLQIALSNAMMVEFFIIWYKFNHFPPLKPCNI